MLMLVEVELRQKELMLGVRTRLVAASGINFEHSRKVCDGGVLRFFVCRML